MMHELIVRLTSPGLVIPAMALMIPILAILRGGRRRRESPEENQMVQEIHAQLEHMVQRVESLEAILMDRMDHRPGKK